MAHNLTDPNTIGNLPRAPLATETSQRNNALCFYNFLHIRFPSLASAYIGAFSNVDPTSWLQGLDAVTATTTEAQSATVILDILEHIDDFLAHKDSLLAESHRETVSLRDRNEELLSTLLRTGPPTTSRPRRITTDPPPFKADHRNTVKRQEDYTTWKSALLSVFARDSPVFSSDFDQILHVASLLIGDTITPLRGDFDKITQNPTDKTYWRWQTLEQLWEFLDKRYATVDLALLSSHKFDDLSHGKQDFRDFVDKLRDFRDKSHKTSEQMVDALKRKVNKDIRDLLVTLPGSLTPSQSEFDKWVAVCQDFQDKITERNHNEKWSTRTLQHQERQPQTTTTGGDAMDLSQVQSQPQPQPQSESRPRKSISWEERNRRRNEGLCLYCGQPGHMKANCPVAPRPSSPQNSQRPLALLPPPQYPQTPAPLQPPPHRP